MLVPRFTLTNCNKSFSSTETLMSPSLPSHVLFSSLQSAKRRFHMKPSSGTSSCTTWQAEYGNIPAEYFVWLDEASVDDQTNQCRDSWEAVGRACIFCATFIRGQRFLVLPALTHKGIIALDICEQGEVHPICWSATCMLFHFSICLCNLFYFQAPQLNPFPAPCSVVVVDNCAIHHDEEIRCIIEDECGKLQSCNSVIQINFHPLKVPDLFIFHLTLLTTTLLNKLSIPSKHGFVAMRLMLSMLKSHLGWFNRLYSLLHQKWQKGGLKTVDTHSLKITTCNYGQQNTICTIRSV